MRFPYYATLLIFFLETSIQSSGQDKQSCDKDTLEFSGQVSAWGILNVSNELDGLQLGARYIPSLYYGHDLNDRNLVDFELSGNFLGYWNPVSTFDEESDYDINLYRGWARVSSTQWELRFGLQKLNFGTATLLRPLMWFDQVDPRDPLKLSSGVWGGLARYYSLNNATAWAWCLYGNKGVRTWDIGPANTKVPEFGGRYQHPLPVGEMALTYHHRVTDTREYSPLIPEHSEIPENRFGFDMKLDIEIGVNMEGAWIHKSIDLGAFTNQEVLNIGLDYTFGIGNGLTLIFEQVVYSSDKNAFAFYHPYHFSGMSLSYPFGIADYLNAIVFYDWTNQNSYNFISWNHRFKWLSAYMMAFVNPKEYKLPQQGNTSNLFSGHGIQFMLIYNH